MTVMPRSRSAGSSRAAAAYVPSGGEGPDVQLVDHLAAAADAAPVAVAPGEPRRIDDRRQAVRPVGLRARRGVGIDLRVVVQPEAVAVAGAQPADHAREVAVRLGGQRGRALGAGAVDDRDTAAAGRPHARVDPAFDQLEPTG